MESLYNSFGDKPFVGFWRFRKPGLVIKDPEVVKTILFQDFKNFHQNGFRVDPHLDPLVHKNPFMIAGEEWKTTRQTLTPSFTNSKLKPLLPLMEEVAAELVQYLRTNCHTCGPDGFEAKDLSSKYTMEMVATCAFGIKGESFKNPNAKLREMTMQVVRPGFIKNIEFMIIQFLPSLAALLKIRLMPKEVDEFFRSIVRDVLADREKKNTTRNDYIQNLIYLKKKAEETGGSYTEEDITGHAVTFMTDGFETSSITMGFIMHHLSQNPHIQEAMWKEVKKAREENQGQLPFEVLMELPLLDQVIHETLRLHPPLMALEKVCTTPTTLRASDGTEVHAPRGLLCVVPLRGLHKDPRFFHDPERFDPDRFSPGRKSDIPKCTYLGFGGGPRQCLGMRFALQQIKLGLASIVENFVIKTTPRTPKVIEQDPTYFLACAKDGLWVRFEERKTAG
ncbi:hypothetical protein R5R35_000159 [Gryllus longicercus]|uniref:Cytochrome P450 n=1 Tax=Gryllus longicercus TaxID=2509291 RepID=A0AAN9V4M2_9ORTH